MREIYSAACLSPTVNQIFMFEESLKIEYKKSAFLFCIGWCLVLLAGWIPILPKLHTFINMWRVELAASVFFSVVLLYTIYKQCVRAFNLQISLRELNFIVLPLVAFIIWSACSMAWSASWKSALYHTLIWTQYLIFYLVARRVLNLQNGYKNFVTLLTIIFVIVSVPAIIEYCALTVFGGDSSLGVRYAKYGEQINAIFPLIAVGVLRLNGTRFAVGLLAVTTFWLFIVCTFSRTNLILFICGAAAIAATVFVFNRFHKYRFKTALAAIALIAAPLLLHSLVLPGDDLKAPIVTRITNKAETIGSGNFRKFMWAVSLEMFRTNPIAGVGAANFGLNLNDYRANYARRNPTDVNSAVAENQLPERSHNEYLQILAELGIVGGLIFMWFLSGIGLMFVDAFKRRRHISLFPFAALLGTALFLLSSVVTSYSFRLMQNGLVFFFVLAVAAKFFFDSQTPQKRSDKLTISPRLINFGCTLGTVACLLLAINCLMRASSAYYSGQALTQPNVEQAAPYFETAFRLDDENPSPHFDYAVNLLRVQRYDEAAQHFRQSIKRQRATSIDYSYLATAQTLSGDLQGAEKTMARAVEVFPRSAFARMRYADLLQRNGKNDLSLNERVIARQFDKKQAQGWWNLITEGASKAAQISFQDADSADAPIYLSPQTGLRTILSERERLYPNEEIKFDFTR